jgi:hypothetical protein
MITILMTTMTSKNISYIALGLFVIVGWNALIIQRDKKMFDAYDRACVEQPQPHPHCKPKL